MIKIIDASGNVLQRFRISDCPMCRNWPIDMAGSCACCGGKSSAMATPAAIAVALSDTIAQRDRLKAALEPFRSGGDWGSVKAWIMGKGFQDHGSKVAKQITDWQTVVDAVLAER